MSGFFYFFFVGKHEEVEKIERKLFGFGQNVIIVEELIDHLRFVW